jgi:hypothetical protein
VELLDVAAGSFAQRRAGEADAAQRVRAGRGDDLDDSIQDLGRQVKQACGAAAAAAREVWTGMPPRLLAARRPGLSGLPRIVIKALLAPAASIAGACRGEVGAVRSLRWVTEGVSRRCCGVAQGLERALARRRVRLFK